MADGRTTECVNSCDIFSIKMLRLPFATFGLDSFVVSALKYVSIETQVYGQ